MWAHEHSGVTPDILVMPASLGPAALRRLDDRRDRRPHAAGELGARTPATGACAAALATLDVLAEERLAENAAARGDQPRRLRALQARHPDLIRDVRGVGS